MKLLQGNYIATGEAPHLYAKDFGDAIHVRQATYYFSYHSVEPWAQASACHNARMHLIRLKVHLNKIQQHDQSFSLILPFS